MHMLGVHKLSLMAMQGYVYWSQFLNSQVPFVLFPTYLLPASQKLPFSLTGLPLHAERQSQHPLQIKSYCGVLPVTELGLAPEQVCLGLARGDQSKLAHKAALHDESLL